MMVMIAATALLAACDNISLGGGHKDDWDKIDESILTTSSGEVQLSDGRRLPYSVTSQRYRAWDAAQSGLDRTSAEHFGDLLDAENPSEASIQSAIDYLESVPAAKEAIERNGLSVRDFVMTTVALEQEMRLATGEGRAPRQPPMPMPPLPAYQDTFATYQPYQPPPSYIPPPTYVPYTPPPPVYTPIDPRDTMTLPRPRVDTVYPTPSPAPPNTPRTVPAPIPVTPTPVPPPVPRDTARPRTDTAPKPVIPPTAPAPIDTSAAPPDSARTG